MHCKDIQAKLIDYLDHKLDAASTAEIRQHLTTCAACSREAKELSELLTTMENSARELPPPSLRESFDVMLQSELNMQTTTTIIQEFPAADQSKDTRGKGIYFSSPIWRVAAAVILVAGGIGIGMTLRSKPAETT